jgi:hypothetical protein
MMMAYAKPFLLLAGIALLSACEGRVGQAKETGGAKAGGTVAASSASGKSEEGKLSIKAPGFDMKIDIPKGLADRADTDSELIYPGAALGGMHIEAGSGAAGKRNSGVELRFTSREPIDKVAAWYRDPARAGGFSTASERRDGEALVISGTQKSDGDPFNLRLSPAAAGGTEGRLTLTDRVEASR